MTVCGAVDSGSNEVASSSNEVASSSNEVASSSNIAALFKRCLNPKKREKAQLYYYWQFVVMDLNPKP